MIFNIVYHTPGDGVSASEGDIEDCGLNIEVQMAWGGSSTYTFVVSDVTKVVLEEKIAHLCDGPWFEPGEAARKHMRHTLKIKSSTV